MNKQDRLKFWLVALIAIGANLYDLSSTYFASPRLVNEWNVLHRQLGLGWYGLIGSKIVGVSLALLGYAYYLRNRDLCYPAIWTDGIGFFRHFTFGRNIESLADDPRIPPLRHLGVLIGYFWAVVQILIVWVATDNMILRYGFYHPMRNYSEAGYHLMQAAIVGIGVVTRL